MEALGPLNLIVKAPNLKIEDKRVECNRSWTVRQLKEHLSTVYPEKPHQDQQKLVYFGKLLKDEACLQEVLTQDSYDDAHTVHLVCPSRSPPSDAPAPYVQRFSAATTLHPMPAELRQRLTTSPSPPVATTEQLPASVAPVWGSPEQVQQWSSYWAQFSHTTNPQPETVQQRLWLQMYQQQTALYSLQMQQMTSQYMAASSEQQAANADAAQPIGGQLAEQRAAAQDDVVRMNAQGGVDNEGGQNDWLDASYTMFRVGMLLMLLYFYTTFSRFAVVVLFGFIFYVARGNLFRPRRRRPAPQAGRQQPQPNEQNPAAENQNNENNEIDHGIGAIQQEPNNNIPAEVENQGSWIDGVKVVVTFIVTFFSSLIPQNPAAIAN